jgi:hypothetical protein
MSEWIDRLREDHQLQKFEQEMTAEELNLAKTAAQTLMPDVIEQIKKDVNYFMRKFSHRRQFEGPRSQSDGAWYVITREYPLHKVTYRVEGTTILFEQERQLKPDDSRKVDNEIIRLMPGIGKDAWFEYKGEKLMRPEDVSRVILKEFFESVIVLKK